MVSAHTKDRVRSIPCDHNSEEERRVKQRVRRDVEPPEVRRYLRLESRVERTEEAFAGFPAMEPLVQHPVEKEPSRKLSDG